MEFILPFTLSNNFFKKIQKWSFFDLRTEWKFYHFQYFGSVCSGEANLEFQYFLPEYAEKKHVKQMFVKRGFTITQIFDKIEDRGKLLHPILNEMQPYMFQSIMLNILNNLKYNKDYFIQFQKYILLENYKLSSFFAKEYLLRISNLLTLLIFVKEIFKNNMKGIFLWHYAPIRYILQ